MIPTYPDRFKLYESPRTCDMDGCGCRIDGREDLEVCGYCRDEIDHLLVDEEGSSSSSSSQSE